MITDAELKLLSDPTVPVVVLYHAGCVDGAVAATSVLASAHHLRSDKICPVPAPVRAIPCRYDALIQPFSLPELDGAFVTIVDFSFGAEYTLGVCEHAKAVRWVDHHKTAAETVAALRTRVLPNLEITFDLTRSGAGLAFELFQAYLPDTFKRLAIYTEDYDLWRKELPESDEVHLGSRFMILDLDLNVPVNVWTVAHGSVDELRSLGRTLALARDKRVRANARRAYFFGGTIDGKPVRIAAVNCSDDPNELSDYISANNDVDFVAVFHQRADRRWKFSLRARSNFDVTKVARIYGGGGHAGAAGFEVKDLPAMFTQTGAGDRVF